MIASSSKKAKRKTKFDDSYIEKHNFIIKCSSSIQDNSFKFQFTICNVDLSSAHGGINNVDHHIKTEKCNEYEKNLQRKGFVTLNDILRMYRTITIKKIFLEYFEIVFKLF